MLVILLAPARSCASSESVSRHEKNSEPSNKPRMERSIPAPPSQGGCLPKDQRENEPKFYVKRSSEPHFMPGKRYSLPNLPYKYNALEPTISEKIMTLHHDKHHL